jgi:hypothetical protein
MCIRNSDRRPSRSKAENAAPTPTGFLEIVSDDFPVLLCQRCLVIPRTSGRGALIPVLTFVAIFHFRRDEPLTDAALLNVERLWRRSVEVCGRKDASIGYSSCDKYPAVTQQRRRMVRARGEEIGGGRPAPGRRVV